MLKFTIDASGAVDYCEEMKYRVLVGIRLGMQQAMEELAEAAGADGPHRKGFLAARIERSAHVQETPEEVMGLVGASGFGARLLRWLQEGVNQPAVDVGAARAKYARIQERLAGGKRVTGAAARYTQREPAMIYDPHHTGNPEGFFTKHRAFAVPGRPWMQETLESRTAQILDTIRQNVAEAMEA